MPAWKAALVLPRWGRERPRTPRSWGALVASFALSGAALLAGCGPGSTAPLASTAPCKDPRFATGRDSVQCGRLVDSEGRVLFLHGVNARVSGVFDVTFSDGRKPLEPIPDLAEADVARMREMGLNALRLPINWSALEPTENGGFDEAYLDKVQAAVDLAGQHGVRVLVDFHQDAYSKEIGEDGAPLWAIVPAPEQLLGGPLDDLGARRLSKQVLAAFGTFFGKTDDGKRLRDRFGKAVAHVAARFAKDASVTGIEIYNEPVAGDSAVHDMHAEVLAAARPADPGRLYYFEPSALRNQFDHAPDADRDPWPGTVYAPHVYTLAFGGSDAQHQSMTKDTLRPSNESAREEADSWKAPLAVGEYGYDPNGIQADNYLAWQTDLQDEYQASGFFWVWKEESQGSWGLFDHDDKTGAWTERAHVRQAITRVAPEAVSGWPESFGYDREKKRFEMTFTADPAVTAKHRIFVPGPDDFAAAFDITCDGKAVTADRDPKSGVVEIACGGDDQKHVLAIAAR
jgi:endoglycosylceramidase